MTAPVTQARREREDWAVRFTMPARYRLDQLLAPEHEPAPEPGAAP